MAEFVAWEKTARYYRDIVITEKIDGTNAAIVIEQHPFGFSVGRGLAPDEINLVVGPDNPEQGLPDHEYVISAQSRKRLITPTQDNAGFAKWVLANSQTLVADLGPGRHYGEWWGSGIQRKYGMSEKVFSLFNTHKWFGVDFETLNLTTVPLLYSGPHEEAEVTDALSWLREYGSAATQDWNDSKFANPEGICIFHTAANRVFKVTLENDEVPKSLAA